MKLKIKNPATISGLQNKLGCFLAVLVAGFLIFSMPAQAITSYTRSPSGSPATNPFTLDVSFTDYVGDTGCDGYPYWGIQARDVVGNVIWSDTSNEASTSNKTYSDITLPAGDYGSIIYACSNSGSGVSGNGNNIEGAFTTLSAPVIATIWIPDNFVADIGSYVNDFINDGAPAIILVIGLTLATLIINWLLSFFTRRKK